MVFEFSIYTKSMQMARRMGDAYVSLSITSKRPLKPMRCDPYYSHGTPQRVKFPRESFLEEDVRSGGIPWQFGLIHHPPTHTRTLFQDKTLTSPHVGRPEQPVFRVQSPRQQTSYVVLLLTSQQARQSSPLSP